MRVVMPFPSPEIESQIQQIDASIEVITLGPYDPLPDNFSADALLAIGVDRSEQLTQILANPDLVRWIHVFGTGVDNFPLDDLGDRLLTCSRGAHALPIAEWVMAMILGYEKRLPQSWVSAPPENWHSAELGQVSGKTLGLLGFGCIGSLVAERALAFGMKIKALTRTGVGDWPDGVEPVDSFERLVADTDHLVLAAPATAATHHIINADSLQQCLEGVHIVNVARGSLINQDALKEALDGGHVGGASLDVVDPEPLPDNHWLYAHPAVRLSPHISWSAPHMLEKLAEPFVNNVRSFLNGEPMHGVVDIKAGY